MRGLYSLKPPPASRTRRLAGVVAVIVGLLLTLPGCGGPDTEEGPDAPLRTAADATNEPAAAGASAATTGTADATAPERRRHDDRPAVVFLGTSLTAGYGLPESQAFPALVQERIDARGLDFRVVNAGVSGDTSAGGLRRIDWLLRLPVAVLVLELGANDMLRGQSVEALERNLRRIVERTREVHPDARLLIAGMRAAPNLGPRYARAFDAVFPALAERFDAVLVPFLLADVAGVRRLNQPDGIHPTAEGHRVVAERIWRALEPLLEDWSVEDRSEAPPGSRTAAGP